MGIRVYKCLGYGVDDIQTKGSKPKDPRFNNAAYKSDKAREEFWSRSGDPEIICGFFEKEEEAIKDLHHQIEPSTCQVLTTCFYHGFKMWLKEEQKKAKNNKFPSFPDISQCLVYKEEFGLNNVLLMIPVDYLEKWKRGGSNDIDYYEEKHKYKDECPLNWAVKLNQAIYPHNYWCKYREDHLPKKKSPTIEHVKEFVDHNSDRPGALRDDYYKLFGGKTNKHLRLDYRPILPVTLTATLWWHKAFFPDIVAFANELRPMLYTYWS